MKITSFRIYADKNHPADAYTKTNIITLKDIE